MPDFYPIVQPSTVEHLAMPKETVELVSRILAMHDQIVAANLRLLDVLSAVAIHTPPAVDSSLAGIITKCWACGAKSDWQAGGLCRDCAERGLGDALKRAGQHAGDSNDFNLASVKTGDLPALRDRINQILEAQ